MVNDLIEAFFDERLGVSFEQLHRDHAVPTAEISTRFTRPSRLGDVLTFQLKVQKVGGSSLGLEMTATCGDEVRLICQSVLVYVNAQGRPCPWPDALKAALNNELEGSQ